MSAGRVTTGKGPRGGWRVWRLVAGALLLAGPARAQLEPDPDPGSGPGSAPDDPIGALSETASGVREAATDFATWVSSGSQEALLAVAVLIGLILAQIMLRRLALAGLVKLPRRDSASLAAIAERMIRRFRFYFIFAVALQLTAVFLNVPYSVEVASSVLLTVAAVVQLAEWVQEAALSSIRRATTRRVDDSAALVSAVNVLRWFVNFAVWTVAALLLLSNLNVNIVALLAGLGIGGIAIGFAAQGIFRDLFSSLSIILDKPFQVGDTIRYNDTWGAVEEIGLKTTRIRARSGEQIIMSNTALLDHEIHNMRRITMRRIETVFGIVYQTDPKVAEAVPGMVAAMFKDIKVATFDRCGLAGFGPSSLDYDLVFFTVNPDYNRAMAAKSRVLLALFRMMRERGIEFAYPTRTVFLEGGEQAPPVAPGEADGAAGGGDESESGAPKSSKAKTGGSSGRGGQPVSGDIW